MTRQIKHDRKQSGRERGGIGKGLRVRTQTRDTCSATALYVNVLPTRLSVQMLNVLFFDFYCVNVSTLCTVVTYL